MHTCTLFELFTWLKAALKAVQVAHKDGVDFLINNAGVLGTFAQIKDQ